MTPHISLIIPNHNGGRTMEKCLAAACASQYESFEVIVVDDCSTDNSREIIQKFSCRLIRQEERGGASRARNLGAAYSKGKLLFFLDADCLLLPDTLARAATAMARAGDKVIIGGTYTARPPDSDFFSTFQSIFINYSETKKPNNPDYIATHAMVIPATVFKKSCGFDENFLPIIEDVEFSHRLKNLGYSLRMDPKIQVQHIFNFSFVKSIKNGLKKSKYWTMYSLRNQDLLSDSGTASREFKVNVITCFLCLALLLLTAILKTMTLLAVMALLMAFNLLLNLRLLNAFYRTSGLKFAVLATLYYTLIYPLAVGAGSAMGILNHSLDAE